MEYVAIPDITTKRLFGCHSVARYMLWEPHTDIPESAASVQKSLTRYEDGNYYRWGIALQEDDSLIGILELLRFEEAANTCSFAYRLGPDFWGRGYGAEALQALLALLSPSWACPPSMRTILRTPPPPVRYAQGRNAISGDHSRKIGKAWRPVRCDRKEMWKKAHTSAK